MPPSDLSLTFHTANRSSSSNSTTPPSETTLADDVDFETSELGVYLQEGHKLEQCTMRQQHEDTSHQEQKFQHFGPTRSSPSIRIHPESLAINTDYESSAAEDTDLFTIGKYENAESALLSYARTNKLDKLQALLQAKLKNETSLNLNFRGQQKQNFSWSALHLACYFGHIQIAELLLSKKQFRDEIDINIKNNSGDTPLHKATLTNRAQIVQLLLSNSANVFIKNCDGLFAKQLTSDQHIVNMLEGAEQTDKNLIKLNMFKAVDNGDLRKVQEYFQKYDMLNNPPPNPTNLGQDDRQHDVSGETDLSNRPDTHLELKCDNFPSIDYICQMTDERGNTLLHLAAMRGFKAICVYLLEHGFDPYRRNNLGQTCIDITSYQLRQLFMSVKPASNQLKRLSQERVARFEGPLMKRVRILGWKQIYVVLENGVILLFNNRKDSMNRSRRGYKYLESASCEPDPNDVGLFTVCFSDRSRATFLVSSDHVGQYTSYRSTSSQDPNKNMYCNQIELVRQKWIDSIRDHIVYSTEFIRKGLKLNDDEEGEEKPGAGEMGDISSLNHLLPMDTIKSFFQEARAHYSILERHADLLCNLVQTLNNGNTFTNTMNTSYPETSQRKFSDIDGELAVTSSTNATTGSRFLGLIRGSRQVKNPVNEEEYQPNQIPSSNISNTLRARNTSTNEFLLDSWPCLLFNLRLLMESTQNTKVTLGQALALMEHQEQLRQNRIQDQEERCRVLEDSLHALARDHHELEKSLSMSQIYQSANACRSMSMSTDLNEYFDAFEDFDDEKTMTPDSSPNEGGIDHEMMMKNRHELAQQDRCKRVATFREPLANDLIFKPDLEEDEDDDEGDDLESNCSALTVETITDQYLSAAETNQTAGELVLRQALKPCSSSEFTKSNSRHGVFASLESIATDLSNPDECTLKLMYRIS